MPLSAFCSACGRSLIILSVAIQLAVEWDGTAVP